MECGLDHEACSPQDRSWQPLLDGPAAERAWDAIEAIASQLPGTLEDPSLADGGAGVALFHAYLAKARNSEAEAEVAVRLAEEAMASALDEGRVSLYDGVLGPGWVLAHLDGWLLDLSDADPDDALDRALLGFLRSPWPRDDDLVSGLVGVGLYALERLPRPAAVHCLERIVDHLAETANYSDDGITWLTRPRLLAEWQRLAAPGGHDDQGLAQGTPGVIALLAQACDAGVAVSKAGRLLEGAVPWLLAQRLGDFPVWTSPAPKPRPAPSARCHGDPGVATALYRAGRAAGNADWEAEAIAIALQATRRPAEDTGVVDAGICHGAAGLAHLYNRLWQVNGPAALRAAALHWTERTLELLPHTAQPGFLHGRTGVGLELLAALGIEPAWDSVLLLSTPSGPPRSHPTLHPNEQP